MGGSELAPIAGTSKTVKIKGKEYKVSPLTIDDLAEFELVVREERNRALLRALEGSNLEQSLLAEAIGAAAAKPVSLRDIDKNMGSMIGVRFLLWCALKKNHPEVKLMEMGLLIDMDNFEEAAAIVAELGGKATKKAKNAKRGQKKK